MTVPPEGPVHVAPPDVLTESHSDNAAVPGADEPHGSGDHGDGHGHDDHGHDEAALGPIDVTAYLTGALGLAIGLVVVAIFAIASGFQLG